jgi:hypothetical protein
MPNSTNRMIDFLFKFLNRIGRIFGVKLSSLNEPLLFDQFYKEYTTGVSLDMEICSFVFSKDRAMQLHAFLSSYFENVINYSKIIVFYKVSDENHNKSYNDLKQIFINKPVVFIEETKFREQLILEVSGISSDKIILYVDDMIFIHKIDYAKLNNIDPYRNILSLSRGKDLNYSSVLLRDLDLPSFKEIENGLFEFSWEEIKYFSDWTYPIGVAGYLYATKEFLAMIKSTEFKAPNSLENALQGFVSIFQTRKGLCPKNVVSVCVHANLVQDEVDNPTIGTFSTTELLEKWKLGERIDYAKFYDKPLVLSQMQEYQFKPRLNVEA